MENLFTKINNLYNMSDQNWNEVLAELYTEFKNSAMAIEYFETKFGLALPKEVQLKIEAMIKDGTLGKLINQDLLGTINNKVDTNKSELQEDYNKKFENVNSSLAQIPNKIEKSVSEFGVIGLDDGSETDKIQNAINYCISNNLKLTFKSDKIYTISKPLNITKLEKDINFNGCAIKAVNPMVTMLNIGTIDMPLKNNKIRKISNVNLDGNFKTDTIITLNQEHNLIFESLNIKNFNISGIKTNMNNYEIIFENILIQGNGGVGLDINSNDNHYNNIIMLDCKTAINNNGFNFFSKVHAWLYDTSLIEGSIFVKCLKSSFFNNCYSDTYQKAFYIIGNSNVSISNCHLFCKETIYNKETCSSAPYFLFFDNEKSSAGVLVNGNVGKYLMIAINGSFGYFSNITNYQGLYNENKFEKYTNIPCGINNSLIINEGFTASYNRLIKKNGRVLCEAKISMSPNFPSGRYIIATFPNNFKPKSDKTLLSFAGFEWNMITPIYTYIHSSAGIEIIIPPGLPNNPTHIHLEFEYDTPNYTEDILNVVI